MSASGRAEVALLAVATSRAPTTAAAPPLAAGRRPAPRRSREVVALGVANGSCPLAAAGRAGRGNGPVRLRVAQETLVGVGRLVARLHVLAEPLGS
eukprot:7521114-Pyramimonas_sp.AAC.1